MMKALILCALCCMSALQAQYILPSKDISLIAVVDSKYQFYSQKKNGKYTQMELNFRRVSLSDSTFYAYAPYWTINNKEFKFKDLPLKKDAFFKVKKLRPTTYTDFANKNFGDPIAAQKRRETKCFSLLNASIATEKKLIFGKHLPQEEVWEQKDDEGYREIFRDTFPHWESYDNEYYSFFILQADKGKQIYVLTNLKYDDKTPYIASIYLPLKKEEKTLTALYYNGKTYKYEELPPIEVSYTKWVRHCEIEDFLTLRPNGKQYELVGRFNQQVLPKAYDTIYYNRYGIVGKNQRSVDVYNHQHQLLKIKNLQSAYLYRIGMEAIADNSVALYNMNGEKVAKLPKPYVWYCGFSFRTEVYRLKRDTIQKNITPYIDITESIGGYDENYADERYHLIDRKAEEEITFINATDYYERNYLSWDKKEKQRTRVFPRLISVKRKGKVGLFYYDYTQATEYTQEEKQELYNNFFFKDKDGSPVFMLGMIPSIIKYMEGKQLLPFAFDKIEQKENEVIYLYKDGKIGFYPQTSAEYDKAIPLSTSFYAIEKNGKKGFLDIHTLQEYF